MKTVVTLTKEEMAFAAKVGTLRTNENKNRADIACYDSNRFNLTSEQANRLGVVVELATAKYLGLSEEVLRGERPDVWAAFVEEKDYGTYLGQPDLLGVIECRRANRKSSPIPLRRKDVQAGAIVVQGYVDYVQTATGRITVPAEVEFLGWSDARADWSTAEVPGWARGGNSRVALEKKPMSALDLSVVGVAL